MTANKPKADDAEERIADEYAVGFDQMLPTHVLLGLDSEGFLHHLDRKSQTVHRLTVGGHRWGRTDLSVRDEVPARALELYIRFVDSSVGWDERWKFTADDLFGERR